MWPFKKKEPDSEGVIHEYHASFTIEVHFKNGDSEMFENVSPWRNSIVVKDGFLVLTLTDEPEVISLAVDEISRWDIYLKWVKEE